MATKEEPGVAETIEEDPSRFWPSVGRGVARAAVVAGRVVGRAAAQVARATASAYRAVDPDLRRHLAQMPLAGLTLLAPAAREVEALPDDGRPPLLLVHGLGGHPGNFLALRALLALRGRRRVYALGFPSSVDLDGMAGQLRATIAAVIERNGLDGEAQVDVVAHSMGGIVARLALLDAECARRVARLVTLGTPHSGTYLARYLATPRGYDLRPGSKVQERLSAQLPWRADPGRGLPELVALWSEADVVLLPPRAACVEGAENVEMPGLSHYGYLLDPRALQVICDLLEEPAPQ